MLVNDFCGFCDILFNVKVLLGMFEMLNVNLVYEMVDMISN